MRCFSAECLAVLYRSGRSYETPLATAHLLLRELVEVPPDGGLGHAELRGRVLDGDAPAVGEQLE
jgi:hypothetical protein